MNLCGMTACKAFNQWLQQQQEYEDKLQLAVRVQTRLVMSSVLKKYVVVLLPGKHGTACKGPTTSL